jgi:two-component system, LytTR family, response regulator
MDLIRVIVIDDEEEARDLMVNLLREIEFVKVLSTVADADHALTSIIKHGPDLIFLDIEMPEKNAFDLIKEIKEIDLNVEVIIVTGYKKYALEAIKEHVIDYLVKPVDRLDLLKSLVRFKKLKKLSTTTTLKNNRVNISTRNGSIFLKLDQIIYCEAESNYTRIYLTNNTSEISSNNLGRVTEVLGDGFTRISRAHLINSHYLYKVDRKKKICSLQVGADEISLPIPKKNMKLLM